MLGVGWSGGLLGDVAGAGGFSGMYVPLSFPEWGSEFPCFGVEFHIIIVRVPLLWGGVSYYHCSRLATDAGGGSHRTCNEVGE